MSKSVVRMPPLKLTVFLLCLTRPRGQHWTLLNTLSSDLRLCILTPCYVSIWLAPGFSAAAIHRCWLPTLSLSLPVYTMLKSPTSKDTASETFHHKNFYLSLKLIRSVDGLLCVMYVFFETEQYLMIYSPVIHRWQESVVSVRVGNCCHE